MDRCAVFIDGGFMRHVSAAFSHTKISYHKLSEEVANGEKRLRTYYYDCPPFVSHEPTPDERDKQAAFDRFKRSLEREPRFEIRLGRLQKNVVGSPRPFEQKKVDILLACDLLRLSLESMISTAVLFTSDSDFIPAIQCAKDSGTVVRIYYHRSNMVHELLDTCDERIEIDESFVSRIRLEDKTAISNDESPPPKKP